MPDCLSHYQYVALKQAVAEGTPFAEAIKPLTRLGLSAEYLKTAFGELFPEFAVKSDEKKKSEPKLDPLK
jgi:hypothetical protein